MISLCPGTNAIKEKSFLKKVEDILFIEHFHKLPTPHLHPFPAGDLSCLLQLPD